jgi:hypothetical protein
MLKLKQQFHFTDGDILIVDKSDPDSNSSSTLFILAVGALGEAAVVRLPRNQEMTSEDSDRLEVEQRGDSLEIKTLMRGNQQAAVQYFSRALELTPGCTNAEMGLAMIRGEALATQA